MRASISFFFSFVLALALVNFPNSSHASSNMDDVFSGCIKVLKSRTGTVYAGGPAKTTIVPNSNNITVTINKRGGKAQTIVNIYVNNQKRTDIVFNNGNYTAARSRTLNNVRGKTVRIDIVNQSMANKFEYTLRVTGQTTALGSANANLAGQGQKTTRLSQSCGNQATITITRTGGSARANVYVKLGNQTIQSKVFDKNQNRMTLTVNNAQGRTYSVMVKNVSVGNWFRYSMTARSN